MTLNQYMLRYYYHQISKLIRPPVPVEEASAGVGNIILLAGGTSGGILMADGLSYIKMGQ